MPPPQIGSSFAGFCEVGVSTPPFLPPPRSTHARTHARAHARTHAQRRASFLQASRLSPALRDMAAYAIVHHPGPFAAGGHAGGQAGGEDADGGEGDEGGLTARDAIVAVCRHLRSLGCYGPTAYLLPLYGASELPQAFCRLCAVWGGTYMLAQRAHALRVDGGRAVAVEAHGARTRPPLPSPQPSSGEAVASRATQPTPALPPPPAVGRRGATDRVRVGGARLGGGAAGRGRRGGRRRREGPRGCAVRGGARRASPRRLARPPQLPAAALAHHLLCRRLRRRRRRHCTVRWMLTPPPLCRSRLARGATLFRDAAAAGRRCAHLRAAARRDVLRVPLGAPPPPPLGRSRLGL